MTVNKIDSITGDPILGALFSVTYQSSKTTTGEEQNLGTYYTDANGQFELLALDEGWYTVTELEPADGYSLKEPLTQELYLGGNENAEMTFENIPLSALVIKKVDVTTGEVLQGATFQVRYLAGTSGTGGTIIGNYTTSSNGTIVITGLAAGTYVVEETKAPDGYVLDGTPQTIKLIYGETHNLTFYNDPLGGLTIIKKDADDGSRIKGVEFEVREMDGAYVGTYTTNSSGMIYLTELASGWYTVTEIEAADGYLLDSTPHNVEVVDGETTTLTVKNTQASSVMIHKIDSETGKGIYGVQFLVSDSKNNPIGTYVSDQNGYVYIDEELTDGKYYIREIEAADGYILDTTVRTFYVKYGGTSMIEWENTPVMGQIQVTKLSADDNTTNGLAAGSLLQGATFAIYNKYGVLVDTIESGWDGVAISDTLPLGTYTIREISAPTYYKATTETITVELEFSGQIVKVNVLNESIYTQVSVSKAGYSLVMPSQLMEYKFQNIANLSNVALSNFYWRDTLPTDGVRLEKIITGTWNYAQTYSVMYKTNLYSDYRVLASNLSTQQSYTLDASATALSLASGEYITEYIFQFGVVQPGFAQVQTATAFCKVNSWISGGYAFTNKTDVGGIYDGQWIMATDRWVTTVFGTTTLPKTGY